MNRTLQFIDFELQAFEAEVNSTLTVAKRGVKYPIKTKAAMLPLIAALSRVYRAGAKHSASLQVSCIVVKFPPASTFLSSALPRFRCGARRQNSDVGGRASQFDA